MRTLVAFTLIDPPTVAGAPHDAMWVYVGHDDHAYWRVLRDLWAYPEDLLVIEHDVVCRPDLIAAFDACPEPWCTAKYDNMCHPECQEAWANQLGCTRFRAELIAATPDALTSIPEDQRDWHNLCDSIAGNKVGGMPAPTRERSVRAAGFTHHWHEPGVQHNQTVGRLQAEMSA